MVCATLSRVPPPTTGAWNRAPVDQQLESSPLPLIVLPVLPRSVSMIRLLVQGEAIELDLASAVVTLDPGLAFGVLQLANRERPEGHRPSDQFPMALVEAGGDAVLSLAERGGQLYSSAGPTLGRQLSERYRTAAIRGCMARLLGKELGCKNPQAAFLAGLLWEIPSLVKDGFPDAGISARQLLAVLCKSLPAAVVRSAVAGPFEGPETTLLEPTLALVCLAESLLRELRRREFTTAGLDRFSQGPLWRSWEKTGPRPRHEVIARAAETAEFCESSIYEMNPWEFINRLMRRGSWE